jgi:transcriptional regulator with XRE-family HTH domain
MTTMLVMDMFVEKFKAYCKSVGTSPHKIAQETGADTTLVSNWINGKRDPKVSTIMELLKKFSQSETLGLDYPTLAYWWASEHIPKESFEVAFKELYSSDPNLKDKVEEHKRKAQPKK